MARRRRPAHLTRRFSPRPARRGRAGSLTLLECAQLCLAHNDPHEEHDFGVVEHGGVRCFWKIDYYDREMEMLSPDPADPSVTTRVLTIMLADEY